MYSNKKILAVIPARGGSKRLPGKNIKMLGNKPLIAWTIEAAKNSKLIDRIILSSDDKEIIAVAEQYRCEVPFVRPYQLASDKASSEGMLEHAITAIDQKYDYVVLLQPTSPFRTTEDIDTAIRMCIDNRAPSVESLIKISENPGWMFCLSEGGTMTKVCKEVIDSEKYILNGAVYVIEIELFMKNKKIRYPDSLAYIMLKERSVDIDTRGDLEYAEFLLSRR